MHLFWKLHWQQESVWVTKEFFTCINSSIVLLNDCCKHSPISFRLNGTVWPSVVVMRDIRGNFVGINGTDGAQIIQVSQRASQNGIKQSISSANPSTSIRVSIWNVRMSINTVKEILSIWLSHLKLISRVRIWWWKVFHGHITWLFWFYSCEIPFHIHRRTLGGVNEQISHDQTFLQDTKTSIKVYITMEIGHSVDYQHVRKVFICKKKIYIGLYNLLWW